MSTKGTKWDHKKYTVDKKPEKEDKRTKEQTEQIRK